MVNMSGTRGRRTRRIAAVGLGLVAALALLEFGTRVWIRRFASEESFRRYATVRDLSLSSRQSMLSRHWYLGYSLTPDWESGANRHNSLGFRGEEFPQAKPEGEYRIVCLGGSTTYGTGIEDYNAAYPARMQALLRRMGHTRVRVINGGCGGWTSYETLFNLHLRILDLEPDAIVFYQGINDLKSRFVWPPEAYRGDNSGHRGVSRTLVMPPLIEHFALARVALTKLGLTVPHLDIERALLRAPEENVWGNYRVQIKTKMYPSGIFADVPMRKILDTNPPVYFERNLRTQIGLARGRGIEVVLATFAHRARTVAKGSEVAAEFDAAFEEMNDVVRDVARDTKTKLVDIALYIKPDPVYFVDEVHFTLKGATLQGNLIARYFDKYVLPPVNGDR